MIDVDGTLIPNKIDGMPSKKVTEAIAQASKKIHIGVATSRPIFMLEHIFDHLQLDGPSILNAGSQIIDVITKKMLWEQPILNKDVQKIKNYIVENNIKAYINCHDNGYLLDKTFNQEKAFLIFTTIAKRDLLEKIIKDLSSIPTIAIHKVNYFTQGEIAILITHASATKQHGIFEVAKILQIEPDEIIGIGDGYNDFPLLMACGLKVAMGNAVEDLKEIADYIAPTVDEDGVADVINRFVLNV